MRREPRRDVLFVALLFAAVLLGTTLPGCAATTPARTVAASTQPPPPAKNDKVELTAYKVAVNDHSQREQVDPRQPYLTDERLQQGYTIVVVGVNGDNSLSSGLAPGLADGGYPGAVEVVDWTTGYWPLFVYHLRSNGSHRAGARKIADKILAYQANHPERPVNLVGFSAGAVLAVEAIEMLPEGRSIDRTVLLAGAISPAHNLTTALRRNRRGICSYYQSQDLALWAGTLVAGTADGEHTASAGAVRFSRPTNLTADERQLYKDKLVQMPYSLEMARSGNFGGHFQCVGQHFVAEWIAPLLTGK